jgi:type II secretion system protein G
MIKQKKTQKGFTLIELLVVIAIIGLLASVVLVALGQSRQKAETAKAKSDFRSIGHALELYRQAHGALPPGGAGLTVSDLITNYLSEYLPAVPVMPDRLVASPNVYYYTNPVDADSKNYNCSSVSGNQEYFVSLTASQAAVDDQEFPILYERDNPVSPFGNERCIDVEPN